MRPRQNANDDGGDARAIRRHSERRGVRKPDEDGGQRDAEHAYADVELHTAYDTRPRQGLSVAGGRLQGIRPRPTSLRQFLEGRQALLIMERQRGLLGAGLVEHASGTPQRGTQTRDLCGGHLPELVIPRPGRVSMVGRGALVRNDATTPYDGQSENGGASWTRTRDLSLIRTAL